MSVGHIRLIISRERRALGIELNEPGTGCGDLDPTREVWQAYFRLVPRLQVSLSDSA